MGSLFSVPEYTQFRFHYPPILFSVLKSFLSPALRSHTLRVLDAGSGTGLVSESFLDFYPCPLEIELLDPDAEMLKAAQDRLGVLSEIQSFHHAPAEDMPLDAKSVDLILIGSAWHWMNHSKVVQEIDRVLRPGGGVYVFESQFPKSPNNSDLNQWIKTKFNTEWKPHQQTPRGSLEELTEVLRNHSELHQQQAIRHLDERPHTLEELIGVIISQSRYQHFKKERSAEAHESEIEKMKKTLGRSFLNRCEPFLYLYEGFFFKKRI